MVKNDVGANAIFIPAREFKAAYAKAAAVVPPITTAPPVAPSTAGTLTEERVREIFREELAKAFG